LTTLVRGRGNLSRAGLLVSVAVLLQITLGIATVHFGMPLPLATLHNAGAALLVASMIWLLRALWPVPPQPAAALGMVPLRRVNRPE
jgi:heme a synthase